MSEIHGKKQGILSVASCLSNFSQEYSRDHEQLPSALFYNLKLKNWTFCLKCSQRQRNQMKKILEESFVQR